MRSGPFSARCTASRDSWLSYSTALAFACSNARACAYRTSTSRATRSWSRSGKGDKDRVTMLPAGVKPALVKHLEAVRARHQVDLRAGAGWVELPNALA